MAIFVKSSRIWSQQGWPFKFMNGQKFFVYARKSTDNEDMQVRSIADQLSVLRDYAKSQGLFVYEELVEKQSAKIPGRPIFNAMLDRIESGEATGILSWHPDRLARNSVDGGKILYLVDRGVITSLKFPQFWFEPTAQGKFMLSLAFGQSKYYIDSLSENTKRGLHQKAKSGDFPAFAPIGYQNDSRTKSIVIDKKISPVILRAFELYSKNNSRLEDISKFLFDNNVRSRGGKPYHRSIITKIITNPFYYGYFYYCKELFRGNHEPIVSKKLFDKVQEVFTERCHPMKFVRDPLPLTGLFRCGECGMMITGEQKTKYYPRTNHTAIYTYYRCTKKSKTHPQCSQSFVREQDLVPQLSGLLQKVSLTATEAGILMKLYEKDKLESASLAAVFVQEKKEEIKNINKQLQFLLDSYLDQIVDRNDYLDRKNELMGKRKSEEEQILNLEQKQNNWLGPLKDWIIEASQVDKVANGTSLKDKKVLALKIYGSNLVLQNETAGGDAVKPWAALCAAPTGRDWVRPERIGLSTSSMSMKHSTSELRAHIKLSNLAFYQCQPEADPPLGGNYERIEVFYHKLSNNKLVSYDWVGGWM